MALAARVSGGCVLITTALERELSSEELLSVIDHEEAHLRLGLDRWVWLAQLNRECFPWLLSARLLAERVGLLVELVADDEAARSRGVAATSGRSGPPRGVARRRVLVAAVPARARGPCGGPAGVRSAALEELLSDVGVMASRGYGEQGAAHVGGEGVQRVVPLDQ